MITPSDPVCIMCVGASWKCRRMQESTSSRPGSAPRETGDNYNNPLATVPGYPRSASTYLRNERRWGSIGAAAPVNPVARQPLVRSHPHRRPTRSALSCSLGANLPPFRQRGFRRPRHPTLGGTHQLHVVISTAETKPWWVPWWVPWRQTSLPESQAKRRQTLD